MHDDRGNILRGIGAVVEVSCEFCLLQIRQIRHVQNWKMRSQLNGIIINNRQASHLKKKGIFGMYFVFDHPLLCDIKLKKARLEDNNYELKINN